MIEPSCFTGDHSPEAVLEERCGRSGGKSPRLLGERLPQSHLRVVVVVKAVVAVVVGVKGGGRHIESKQCVLQHGLERSCHSLTRSLRISGSSS